MTRIEKWSRIETAIGDVEELVDAVRATPDHPDYAVVLGAHDAVHNAMSMAGYAVEGDDAVCRPRGTCREIWSDAYASLKLATDHRLKELVSGVRVLLR